MPPTVIYAAKPFCFGSGMRAAVPLTSIMPRLDCEAAAALGQLVPLLGCGEEAAALAFDGLAERDSDASTSAALRCIADEERVHGCLLQDLASALPQANEPALRTAARRFHIDLGRGSGAHHLARIAAIDAGVCMVLSRLLGPAGPIAGDPFVAPLLSRIRRDEARHVTLSRRIVIERTQPHDLDDVAAAARDALANVLTLASDAFEALCVDPSRLYADLRKLPDGLLRA